MHALTILEIAAFAFPLIVAFSALAWHEHRRKANQAWLDRVMSAAARAIIREMEQGPGATGGNR